MSIEGKSSNTVIQSDTSKNHVISSLLWKFLERAGTQGVQFVIQIVLARILCPEDYGILAILTAFIALANVFVQSGFNTSLIQKKDSDEADFSSVFWLSLFVSLLLYIILFFVAPFIARFYKNDILTSVLRILSLTLFFGALNSVQSAMVSKTMQFKKFFFSSMGGALGSGILGIILACSGLGVWALVVQQLANNLLISVILWMTVKWSPKFVFSLEKVKSLFSFGWKLLCSGLLDTGYRQIYNLVIGRVFTSSDLGIFSRGEQFPQVIATNLDGSIQSVMLPTLSSHNDSAKEVKRITRRSISTSSYVLMPCMLGMAAIAKNLVLVLLTEKWLPCVPFLQFACLAFALYPVHTANLTAINAMGRSDVFLKVEVIKKIIGISVLVVTVPFGLVAMAAGRVVSGLVCTFVNAHPNRKILDYGYGEQWMDILPYILAAAAMSLVVYFIGFVPLPAVLVLIVQITVGITFYILVSRIFSLEAFSYLLQTLREFRRK